MATPTDAQIQAFYDENTEQFFLPETKRLTYAVLSPDMVLDQVTVDESAIKKLFEDRAADFNQPERRLVERLVFGDTAKATDAKAQLEVGGTTFEQLVQDRGLALSDVDLGDLTVEQLGEAAEAVFAAQVGDVVGPLPSDLGPALFRVNGTLAERITPFEQVQAELRDELAFERARRLIEAQSEDVNDLLAGGATLEELEADSGMKVDTINWTTETTDDIAAYETFRTAAMAVTADDFPEIGFFKDGSIFALRLDEVLAPRPEPLDEARSAVQNAWVIGQTQQALQSKADGIIADLKTDGDFTNSGLPFRVENALTRTAFLENTPADFMNQVFDMELDQIVAIPGAGNVLIVRLEETLPPAETDELIQMQTAFQQQMNQALAQNLFDAYVRDAQTRSQPMLDQAALNAVQANFQ